MYLRRTINPRLWVPTENQTLRKTLERKDLYHLRAQVLHIPPRCLWPVCPFLGQQRRTKDNLVSKFKEVPLTKFWLKGGKPRNSFLKDPSRCSLPTRRLLKTHTRSGTPVFLGMLWKRIPGYVLLHSFGLERRTLRHGPEKVVSGEPTSGQMTTLLVEDINP